MTLGDYKRVLDLLEQVPKPPEAGPPVGAAPEQINATERQIGYPIPASLRCWLSLCNGYIAGPGVLYGARPDDGALDIASAISLWPEWQSRRWVPVASDGTGNAYLLDGAHIESTSDVVYFVDCSDDPSRFAYAVGSSIPHFLTFLLERELGERGWPFDSEYVLARDPGAASIDPRYLPWHVQ